MQVRKSVIEWVVCSWSVLTTRSDESAWTEYSDIARHRLDKSADPETGPSMPRVTPERALASLGLEFFLRSSKVE